MHADRAAGVRSEGLEPPELARKAETERRRRQAPAPDDRLRQELPLAAGNQVVARYIAARQAATARPPRLPARTSETLPGSGVLLNPERRPAVVAEQLGGDFDASRAAPMDPEAASANAAAVALARLDALPVDDIIATLQILRLNGSPGSPASRAPFAWIVQSSASASPSTRAAVAALARPGNVTPALPAGLAGEDGAQLQAFVNLSSWDDPRTGLPRKHPRRQPTLSDDQRRQVEFIRQRRQMATDRGRELGWTSNRRLAYNGTPSADPRPAEAPGGSLNAAIWQELDTEGSASSVNTWDNQKFTWGKGMSALALLRYAMTAFFTLDPGARQELMEAGFTYSSTWLFVDVRRGHVLEGQEALEAFGQDRRFVSLLIDLAQDPEHQQHFVDAQWQALSEHGAGAVPQQVRAAWPNRWSTESVRFAAHCVHWGYDWNVLAAVGPDLKRMARWIARRKATEEKPGVLVVDSGPAQTIMHFANRAAERYLGAAGPMPRVPDQSVFYFKVGEDTYRGLGP